MFAAYKRNAAKRKAARKAATVQFRQRIAEINQTRDIELALIEVERQANRQQFHDTIAKETEKLKAAWSR